jgi:hypothetical protein
MGRRRSLPGIVLVPLLAAFFNPPDQSLTNRDFEVIERVVEEPGDFQGLSDRPSNSA